MESKNLKSVVNTAIEILAYNFKACEQSDNAVFQHTGKTDLQIIINHFPYHK